MHYVRTNPKYKTLLKTDSKNILSLQNSPTIRNAKIAEIADKSIVLLMYNFNRYKKAYLIRTDKTRGIITLPETNLHGEILIEAKRQKGADLVKYVAELIRLNGTMEMSDDKYRKLDLILHGFPFNLNNCITLSA